MRFIRGRTLADILDTDGPLPEDKLWDVARALSSALAASHRAGIVHRDLKPANVMIGPDNTIWLVDFGIALRGQAGRGRAGAEGRRHARVHGAGVAVRAPRPARRPVEPRRPAAHPGHRRQPVPAAGPDGHRRARSCTRPSRTCRCRRCRTVGRRLLQRNPVRRPTADQLAAELRAGMPDRIAPDRTAEAGRPRVVPAPGRRGRNRTTRRPHAPSPPPRQPGPATRADSHCRPTGIPRGPRRRPAPNRGGAVGHGVLGDVAGHRPTARAGRTPTPDRGRRPADRGRAAGDGRVLRRSPRRPPAGAPSAAHAGARARRPTVADRRRPARDLDHSAGARRMGATDGGRVRRVLARPALPRAGRPARPAVARAPSVRRGRRGRRVPERRSAPRLVRAVVDDHRRVGGAVVGRHDHGGQRSSVRSRSVRVPARDARRGRRGAPDLLGARARRRGHGHRERRWTQRRP